MEYLECDRSLNLVEVVFLRHLRESLDGVINFKANIEGSPRFGRKYPCFFHHYVQHIVILVAICIIYRSTFSKGDIDASWKFKVHFI